MKGDENGKKNKGIYKYLGGSSVELTRSKFEVLNDESP